MPIYSFRDKETGEIHDEIMSWDQRQEYLKDNEHLESVLTKAPGLVKGTGDRTKPPSGFKEVLSKISEANPTSALAGDYGHKDHKSVKVREAVEKVKKKIGDISTAD